MELEDSQAGSHLYRFGVKVYVLNCIRIISHQFYKASILGIQSYRSPVRVGVLAYSSFVLISPIVALKLGCT